MPRMWRSRPSRAPCRDSAICASRVRPRPGCCASPQISRWTSCGVADASRPLSTSRQWTGPSCPTTIGQLRRRVPPSCVSCGCACGAPRSGCRSSSGLRSHCARCTAWATLRLPMRSQRLSPPSRRCCFGLARDSGACTRRRIRGTAVTPHATGFSSDSPRRSTASSRPTSRRASTRTCQGVPRVNSPRASCARRRGSTVFCRS